MKVLRWQHLEPPAEGAATVFDYIHRYAPQGSHALELRESGFAIRFHGRFHVYCNRCPHAGSPLDWQPGEFFNDERTLLVCHTHGAMFDPESGEWLGGPPCPHGLIRLPFTHANGRLRVPAQITGLQ